MMQAVLKEWDIDRIAALLKSAGEIALQYYDAPPLELKDDRTLVTAADKAVERFLGGSFDAPEEGCYLIGEETVASRSDDYVRSALAADWCFVVDPIDGTAPYTARLPVWGISIGFMRRGMLTEGAVYLPALDECLITFQGRILHCKLLKESRWRTFTPVRAELSAAGHVGVGQLQAHCYTFDFTNQIFAWSSCVGAFYWLLTGRLMAYFGDFKLWDAAGMLPMLNLAGFGVELDEPQLRPLSGDLARGGFRLDPAGPDRWRAAAAVIAAPDIAIVDYIRQHAHDMRTATPCSTANSVN